MRLAAAVVLLTITAVPLGCSCSPSQQPAATTATTTTTTTSSTSPGADAGADGGQPAVDFCSGCSAPEPAGALQNDELDEASGLIASRRHEGVLYLHNDSGDSARFFAVDQQGGDLGVYELAPALTAVDWEDAALGPCGGDGDSGCLYFGDIGDNPESRQQYELLRVSEPAAVGPGVHSVTYERLPFQYPDGSHNSETLLAHPETGELWIVTKVSSGISGIYRFPAPLTPGELMTLSKVGELAPPAGSPRFTAGDVQPRGDGVLLRTYTHLFYYPVAAGADVGGALLAGGGCAVPVAAAAQGEAVAFSAAGDGYLTVSEGAGSSIFAVSCAAAR